MLLINNKVTGKEKTSIEESDLLDLENKYNFKFPKDIKQFYLQHNGGRLERYCYIAEDGPYYFSYFFSIKYGLSSLDTKLKLNYFDDWWPKEFIPFGYDGGGNTFCFHVETGKIYYLYEDDYDDDGNVPIVYLAPDFLSFINNMIEEI